MSKIKSVDEYCSQQEKYMLRHLQEMRALIKSVNPNASEVLRYGVPAFKEGNTFVCYATHKNHIGLYVDINVVDLFSKELSTYKTVNGTIHFPYKEKLPKRLIEKIVTECFT